MLKSYTARTHHVLSLAQLEARTLHHNYIGTEHLLLGLVREEEGLASQILRSFALTTERVRHQVIALRGIGEDDNSGQIPFTPRVKKILETARKEGAVTGSKSVKTEDLLLALLHESEIAQQNIGENASITLQILRRFGTDSKTVEDALLERLGIPQLTPLSKPRAERYLNLIGSSIQEGLQDIAPGAEVLFNYSATIVLPSDLSSDASTEADAKVKAAVRDLVRSKGWEDKLSSVGWIEIS